jgi:transcriptional regulator with XRE-family HTH domain
MNRPRGRQSDRSVSEEKLGAVKEPVLIKSLPLAEVLSLRIASFHKKYLQQKGGAALSEVERAEVTEAVILQLLQSLRFHSRKIEGKTYTLAEIASKLGFS